MQELASVTFTADGDGHCLYHQLTPLQAIGRTKCTRASRVDFNAHLQVWEVRIPADDSLYSHPPAGRNAYAGNATTLNPIRRSHAMHVLVGAMLPGSRPGAGRWDSAADLLEPESVISGASRRCACPEG